MRQPFLHEIISDIISQMVFTVNFESYVGDNDLWTLTGVCNFHHIQPGFTVTIGDNDYRVLDYDYDEKTITLKGDIIPEDIYSFNLYEPSFFHGTPLQQNAELSKIPLSNKTPMVYLLEPYDTEFDYSFDTSIAYKSTVTLCFLTQADIPKWLTEDFYHNALNPMKNLSEEVVSAIQESNLFYTSEQTTRPKYYTRFGIKLTRAGTEELLFSENLSGVGLELRLEVYRVYDCEC